MALLLKEIFVSLLNQPQFHAITADILLILILVELFRLRALICRSSGWPCEAADEARLPIPA